MDYLQYLKKENTLRNPLCKVLNLVINGLPSIQMPYIDNSDKFKLLGF